MVQWVRVLAPKPDNPWEGKQFLELIPDFHTCAETHTYNQSISVKGVLREINSGFNYENLVDVGEISGSTANALGSITESCTGQKAMCC